MLTLKEFLMNYDHRDESEKLELDIDLDNLRVSEGHDLQICQKPQ